MGDIWQFAKDFEKEGQRYYEKLALESTIPELAGVFSFLAQEKKRHFEILDNLQKNLQPDPVKNGSAFEKAGDAFKKLASGPDVPDVIEDAESVYRAALQLEKKSIEYYAQAVDKVDSDDQRAALEFILEQERTHVRVVEAVIEFIGRPREWLENAEWTHFEEY